ncbi:hypothetical protein WZ342_2063 [Enterococcus faecalis]|nr:hypothetical protein WZ342_2063 [Enterococcus faecalis]
MDFHDSMSFFCLTRLAKFKVLKKKNNGAKLPRQRNHFIE